jgi:protein-L-isoaspartate(D-aspartate) O-methyltransferase
MRRGVGAVAGLVDVGHWGIAVAVIMGVSCSHVFAQDPFEIARRQLVQEVILGSGIDNVRVVEAVMSTPRHEFVDRQYRAQAYYDMALPIGESQTISSPYIVAFMTQALDPQPADRVLEIGTGSGYQAAILSPLVSEVYTIEIVPSLGERAERTLRRLQYQNVFVKVGDGYQGWPDKAPFDKIIVTCSPEKIPQPLVDQLREGGLMIIPVGERYQQTLYLMRKTDGKLVAEALQPTLFVPMTGKAEDSREVKPDPTKPRVVNGDFEAEPESDPFVPGWYYQRLTRLQADSAPQGRQYVCFANDDFGRPAHLLQGLPLDGRAIREVEVSAWVKLENVRDSGAFTESATIAMTFYDENRRDLGFQSVGKMQGSHDWKQIKYSFRVPPPVRCGRHGLFRRRAIDRTTLNRRRPPPRSK